MQCGRYPCEPTLMGWEPQRVMNSFYIKKYACNPGNMKSLLKKQEDGVVVRHLSIRHCEELPLRRGNPEKSLRLHFPIMRENSIHPKHKQS
jgi:hypothetical protein